jgi:hypothetical protein
MSAKQRCVHRSKTCCQTLKHFDNVFATGRNKIVEVFESLAVPHKIVEVFESLAVPQKIVEVFESLAVPQKIL